MLPAAIVLTSIAARDYSSNDGISKINVILNKHER